MRKIINGSKRAITIENIEILSAGFEGYALATSDKQNSLGQSLDDIPTGLINKQVANIIGSYNKYMRSIPFPFVYAQSYSKYKYANKYIQKVSLDTYNEDSSVNEMESKISSDGLYISIDKLNCYLLLNNFRYQFISKSVYDNLEISAEHIREEEYKWCFENIGNIKDDEYYLSFFEKLMTDFYVACKGNRIIIEYEIRNILNMYDVPNEIEIGSNRIIHIGKNYQYIMDVFSQDTSKSNKSIETLNAKSGTFKSSNKIVKTYDYNIYGKSVKDGISPKFLGLKNENKLEAARAEGLASLFEVILLNSITDANSEEYNQEEIDQMEYRGLVIGDKLVFEVKNEVYLAKFGAYEATQLLGSNLSIYSCKSSNYKNKVYLKRVKRLESGVYKCIVYVYDLNDNTTEICNIHYENSKEHK